MDYGAAAGKYIEAFMKNVNWDMVEQRLIKINKFNI
jgi:superoxide dismutase